MEKLVFSSTHKGYFSRYFWGFFWISVLAIIAILCSERVAAGYKSLGINSFKDLIYLPLGVRYDNDTILLLQIFVYFIYLILGVIAFVMLQTALYGAKEVNTLFKNKDGYCVILIRESYNFPFSKTANQLAFDRIVKIKVEQSSIDRILNTGTLEIIIVTFASDIVTFASGDVTKCKWIIPAVNDPFGKKAEIMGALPDHEGLKIQLSQKS